MYLQKAKEIYRCPLEAWYNNRASDVQMDIVNRIDRGINQHGNKYQNMHYKGDGEWLFLGYFYQNDVKG